MRTIRESVGEMYDRVVDLMEDIERLTDEVGEDTGAELEVVFSDLNFAASGLQRIFLDHNNLDHRRIAWQPTVSQST